MAQLRDNRGRALKDEIDIEAGGVFAVGHAGEGLLVHFLHGFDFAAGGRDFGGDFVDRVFDRLFLAGVCLKQTILRNVSLFSFFWRGRHGSVKLIHCFLDSVRSASIPPAGTARSKTSSTTSVPAPSKRPRT